MSPLPKGQTAVNGIIYIAATISAIAVVMTGASMWFVVAMALAVGLLAGYDLRKVVERR